MDILLQILTLLGAVTLFLFGLSLLSGGLQKVAGDGLRAFLASPRKFRAVNAQLDELHDLAAMGWPRRLASKIRRRIRALVKRTEKAT